MVDLAIIEQGIRATENFLFHKYANNEFTKKMDKSSQISQLESGRTENLLLHIISMLVTYLTPTWLTHMRNFWEPKNSG